jgi:hypothetical protein
MFCQRCGHQQSVASPRYCENCAQPFATTVHQIPQPAKSPKLNKDTRNLAIVGAAFLGVMAIITPIVDWMKGKDDARKAQPVATYSPTPMPESPPTPTPTPTPTPAPTPTAEERILGEPPEPDATGKIQMVDLYFRLALKDYSSAEYVFWLPVEKAKYKGKPAWKTVVRLRAKNSFGAYVVSDHSFFIRQGQIVGVK